MSNHADIQNMTCGRGHDIYPSQSQYKGNHERGGHDLCRFVLSKMNVVPDTVMFCMSVCLDILYRAIVTSCSLSVRTTFYAQGESGRSWHPARKCGGAFSITAAGGT